MVAWGKLDKQGGEHPLIAHMLDVAACFRAICEVNSIQRRLEQLAQVPPRTRG